MLMMPGGKVDTLLPMLTALLLLVPLALDTFGVGATLGAAGLPRAAWVRVGLAFALAEGGMPLAGLAIGAHLARSFSGPATYAAGVLLIGVGLWELSEALRQDDEPEGLRRNPLASNTSLALTALSVSIDELAIGFSLGAVRVSIALAIPYIALQAFIATFAGLAVGTRAGSLIGERAEKVAGVILVALGVVMIGARLAGVEI
jgi:putative Mn2+ efflux pump MntP